MRDPLVAASRPITAWSCLVLPETHDTVQDVSWVHDGRPPNTNGEYFISLITLWQVCSLLQPEFFQLQYFTGTIAPTRRYPSSLVLRTSDSDGRIPRDLPLVECAAWLSHPIHISLLTSPDGQHEVRPCDAPLDAALARACVQDTGGDGDESGGRTLAWLLDAHHGPPEAPLAGGWNVAYDNVSTIVTVRTDHVTTGLAWHGHDRGPGVPNLDGPYSTPSEPKRQAQARDDRTWIQPTDTVVQARDPHEAHGIGVIVKALVQQNAGALLFLRTMACVAALMYLAYSILVLGERPSFVGRLKS